MEDCAEYSDRFLPGYDKVKLLGRGACAVVWLATPVSDRRHHVAIKQAAKGSTGKRMSDAASARKEAFFGGYLFHPGGDPKFSTAQYPGMRHIARLLDHSESKRDIWLVMEFGGTCLTKLAYEIKGEFIRSERVYKVHHLPLLQSMKQSPNIVTSLLRQLLSALVVLADNGIVHSDIKPDNILVEESEEEPCGFRARLIDFGSAYAFGSSERVQVATPEYMPPEALEACCLRSGGLGGVPGRVAPSGRLAGNSSSAQRRTPTAATTAAAPASLVGAEAQPWSFDIWSLGAILLELSLGVPLWLAYKCRVADDQPAVGLFAVPGRDPEKILGRQSDAIRHRGLHSVLRNSLGVPSLDIEFLSTMLVWNPTDRVSPHTALNHPWLRDAA